MQLQTLEAEIDKAVAKIQDIVNLLNVPRQPLDRIDEKYGERVVSIDINIDNLDVHRIGEVSVSLIQAFRVYHALRQREMLILESLKRPETDNAHAVATGDVMGGLT